MQCCFCLEYIHGLRISDILKFRVRDCYQKHYNIREKKTGKQKTYDWNPYLKKALDEYIKDKEPDTFLFQSRKGNNQPIKRKTAYMIIKTACNKCGVYNVRNAYIKKNISVCFYMNNLKTI